MSTSSLIIYDAHENKSPCLTLYYTRDGSVVLELVEGLLQHVLGVNLLHTQQVQDHVVGQVEGAVQRVSRSLETQRKGKKRELLNNLMINLIIFKTLTNMVVLFKLLCQVWSKHPSIHPYPSIPSSLPIHIHPTLNIHPYLSIKLYPSIPISNPSIPSLSIHLYPSPSLSISIHPSLSPSPHLHLYPSPSHE